MDSRREAEEKQKRKIKLVKLREALAWDDKYVHQTKSID